MERGHDMVYVCYDNGAYMNTGIQRSSATPMFADTTTTPTGKESVGKMQNRKDLASIIADHDVAYVGQSTFTLNFNDLHKKAEKAIYTEGASFLNIMTPCPRGWRYNTEDIMEICRLAVETCYWPMFEVDHGKWNLTYEPKKKLPIEDFLRAQGRFKHLFKPENEHLIEEFQKEVDKWIKTYGVRYFSELTNMAVLTEEVGELARVMARKYGDQSFKAGEKDNLDEEIADILWVLLCIANQTGVDVTKAFRKSLEKKTKRDNKRHINNPKLNDHGRE